jgi:hypothetical protein
MKGYEKSREKPSDSDTIMIVVEMHMMVHILHL